MNVSDAAMKKMARDDQRWQHQLEMQKQRFALDVERFELTKQKEARLIAKGDAKKTEATPVTPDLPLPSPIAASSVTAGIHQTLFIGYENDVTTVYEITPSNDQSAVRSPKTIRSSAPTTLSEASLPLTNTSSLRMLTAAVPAPPSAKSYPPNNGTRSPITNRLCIHEANGTNLGEYASSVSSFRPPLADSLPTWSSNPKITFFRPVLSSFVRFLSK
jgi:hypothetical protein